MLTECQLRAHSGERLNSDMILALSGHCKQSWRQAVQSTVRKGVAGRRASGHLSWAARRKGQPEEVEAGPSPGHVPSPRPQLADAVAVVTVGSPGCQTPPQLRH